MKSANKFAPKKRKYDRKRYAKFASMDGLMTSAMERHGIAGQVKSAMIVQFAKEALKEALEESMWEDVRVLSYSNGQLNIVCRHIAAANYVKPLTYGLKQEIEETFPRETIKDISCEYRPQAFSN